MPVAGLLLPARDLPAGHNSDHGQGLGRQRLCGPGQEVHSSAGEAVKSLHALSSVSRQGMWPVLRVDECPTVQSPGQCSLELAFSS